MASKNTYGQLNQHNPWRTKGNRWKNEARGYLKCQPDKPARPPSQRSTWSTLRFWCIFSSHDPPSALFSWNPQFFYVQYQGNFDFWSKFNHFPKYMSIWCIWHKIHAIRGYIQQEFIKHSLDHKEITPSCLLISTNCSSLRGFINILASWSFVLTNSSVMSPFCA